MADTGIELKQLTNWFVNNRKRYWKPRVEARLQQQAHAAAAVAQAQAAAAAVAAVAAVSRASPVTPDSGFRPTLTVQPNNTFVSFDLCSPTTTVATNPPKTDAVSMLTHELSKFIPSTQSSVHAISEASSASSVATAESNDSMELGPEDRTNHINQQEAVANTAVFTQVEKVAIHILKPLSSDQPTIEDVSTLMNVPSERILRTYENCAVSYEITTSDNKKVRSRVLPALTHLLYRGFCTI